jgi:hypothetical protein
MRAKIFIPAPIIARSRLATDSECEAAARTLLSVEERAGKTSVALIAGSGGPAWVPVHAGGSLAGKDSSFVSSMRSFWVVSPLSDAMNHLPLPSRLSHSRSESVEGRGATEVARFGLCEEVDAEAELLPPVGIEGFAMLCAESLKRWDAKRKDFSHLHRPLGLSRRRE